MVITVSQQHAITESGTSLHQWYIYSKQYLSQTSKWYQSCHWQPPSRGDQKKTPKFPLLNHYMPTAGISHEWSPLIRNHNRYFGYQMILNFQLFLSPNSKHLGILMFFLFAVCIVHYSKYVKIFHCDTMKLHYCVRNCDEFCSKLCKIVLGSQSWI